MILENNNQKLKIGFISNPAIGIKTGFQRHIQALLSYLYKKNKYEIFHLVQSFHNDNLVLRMQPWKSQGVIDNNITNTEQFKDENFRRIVSYGNLAVEKWVTENKLDVVIHTEDIWSSHPDFYWKKDWFDFIKHQFVNHTTLDSLPILPEALTWATKIPNFWVWADFAEIEMKKINPELYSHVKTVYGTLNCNEFKPLSSEERKELRKKFNISEDEIIINMTSRNQLRKLFHSNIEALAKYKRLYPTSKKVKLLFHTSWSEQGGWPLQRIRDEFKLDKEDILTTYFCQKCGDWHIAPYEGENKDCLSCGEKGLPPNHQAPLGRGKITAGITSTISNTDLSKIYGICDAMSHQMTSGGLEYAIVEGLLCGLIVGTNGYSSGLTFTKEPFVENIDFNLTRECNTAFYKAVPNPNSICRFFKKIADLPLDKKKELSQRGRKFILDNFHVENIGKKFEDFFDSCKKLDWDNYAINKKLYDEKKPDAEININNESDLGFILELYKNILKMDMKPDDEGVQNWLNNFKNLPDGLDEKRINIRRNIERSFRTIATEHNSKNNSLEFKSLIDFDRPNKRGLIVIKESGGDAFIVSSLFRSFHEKYKGYDLYVSVDPKFSEVFQGNPYIHKIIPWHPIVEQEMLMIGSGNNKEDAFFHYFGYPALATQKFLNYLSHDKAGKIQ